MEIDHQSTRKRCRGEYSVDDCTDVYPTAKKTRQFHFQSTDAADAFASAFALAQVHRNPFDNSTPTPSTTSHSAASTPNEGTSSHSSPGAETEDPFRTVMSANAWQQSSQLDQQRQSQLYQQQQQQSHQPQLHPPPGRRGMIISGWNQARRNDNMAGVVQSWPQR